MKKMMLTSLISAISIFAGVVSCTSSGSWEVDSKDRAVRFILTNNDNDLSYTIYYKDTVVIEKSLLGVIMDGKDYGSGAKVVSISETKEIHDSYTLKVGKKLNVVDDCRQQTFTFKSRDGKKFDIEVRVYSDGAAFRYGFTGTNGGKHQIDSEKTEFSVPQKGKAWIHPYDWNNRKKPSYEQYCLNGIDIGSKSKNGRGWAFPMLFNTNNIWIMVTEAHLDGSYPATHVDNSGTNAAYKIRFPEPDEPVVPDSPKPVSKFPWHTPWRVIIVGSDLNTIFASQMVQDLNPPSVIKDDSWIKPGRSSWSWWYSGGSARDYRALLKYVDLSAEMGWEYTLLDSGWDRMGNGGTMEDVVKYATGKGVGVWLWYHSGAGHEADSVLQRRIMSDPELRSREMQRISALGVKGIKVDFFDTDKQRIIQLYPQILKDAAENHLMVDFHGATLPRGFERTYPNLMTTEAVRGAESLGNQERCDKAASQDATLVFTRNVVGSMDYTPVTFSNKVRRGVEAERKTTMAHQLALSVVFESGFQCFADRGEAYLSLPEAPKQFLKDVPNVWDESCLLAGYPSDYAIVARRSGNIWFIGGINGKDEDCEIEFFLPDGCKGKTFTMIVDGKDKDHFNYEKVSEADSKVRVKMLAGGGFVAEIK